MSGSPYEYEKLPGDGNVEEKRKKRVIIIISFLIAVIIVLLILLLSRCGAEETTEENSAPGIDPAAGEYVAPENETDRGIDIPGWDSVTVAANNTEVSVDFYNPETNKDRYYLSFELRLVNADGSCETLYQSGLVEPGLHIQSITLSRPLPPGKYDAVVHIQPYTMDEEKTATNNADVAVTLIASE